MAKRFTDTDKWKMAWYRKLGAEGRDLWNYLHDNCDHAGFLEVDCERMTFELGFVVTLERIKSVLNGKFHVISPDRIFLPAFLDFQYGVLNELVKPHQAVIRKMKSQGVWEQYAKGYPTLKDKEQDKDKDQDQAKDQEKEEGGLGETKTSARPVRAPDVRLCIDDWVLTLKHFERERKLIPGEDVQIAAACSRFGAENVLLAFKGARQEPKGKEYDPANFVSLDRYLDPKKFKRFVSLGVGESPDGAVDFASMIKEGA